MDGRTGGRPSGVHVTYNRIRCGTTQVGAQDTALSQVSIPCFEATVYADPDNTDTVWIGEYTDGCHVPVRAGENARWPVNDVEKIMARAGSGIQTVHWAAGTESA